MQEKWQGSRQKKYERMVARHLARKYARKVERNLASVHAKKVASN